MLRLFLSLLLAGLLVCWGGTEIAQAQILAPSDTSRHPVIEFYATPKSRSISDAFAEANLPYYPQDKISVFPDLKLGLGGLVRVERAMPVELIDGKRTYLIRTWQATLSSMLKEQGILLGEEDKITPSVETILTKDSQVQIVRVARTVVKSIESVPFKVVEKNDDSIYRGERVVSQPGKDGMLEKSFLVIREDGELVSRSLISSTYLEKPQDRIIRVGTKLKIGRTYTGKATWYDCCGTKVACDKFPKGTQIRVTNLQNGKQIIATVDGCICGGRTDLVVDLHPSYFTQLGGSLSDGILPNMRIEEILN